MMKDLINISVAVVITLIVGTSAHAQGALPPAPSEAVPAPTRSAHKLENFSRLSEAIGERIVLIDPNGVVREGVLAAMTADAVTMRFASGMQSIARAEIASAERMKDPISDGVAKGLIFGALAGIGDVTGRQYLTGVAIFGVIGYLLDAGEGHRQPMYRAPGFYLQTASAPAAKTVAFRIRF